MKTSYDNALFNKYSAIKTIKLLEEISLIKNSETNQKIFTLNDQIKFKVLKKNDKKIINEIDFL